MVALILSIVGGTKAGQATTQNDFNSGLTFRHVGSILFIVLYGLVVLLFGYFWTQKAKILRYRQMVRIIPLTISICS